MLSYNLFYSFAFTIYNMSHNLMVPLSTRNIEQRGSLSVFNNISRFYSNPPKTGSFRPFKTIVEKFVNAKIMLFSLFLPVGKNRGKNSGKNKIRRILI